MATQQYPAIDPNQALPAADAVRSSISRKEYCPPVRPRNNNVHHGQLWMGAFLEAQSWKDCKISQRVPAFEAKWDEAKESIETSCRILRNLAAAGHKLRGDAELLLKVSGSLRESLQETKKPVREARDLPQVQCGDWTSLPRAYAGAVSYLQAVNYEFEEDSFEQFFRAMQETVPFKMTELWHLRAFLELALLESVGGAADRLEATTHFFPMALAAQGETQGTEYLGALSLTTLLTSLQKICGADWKELFERVNAVDHTLRLDPREAYAQMDFQTRSSYRAAIADLAKRSKATELEIARKAIELSGQPEDASDERIRERKSHVGYYVVGDG